MNVDLLTLLLILAGFVASGPADEVYPFTSVGVVYQLGSDGYAATLEVGFDVALVRYKTPPPYYKWSVYTCAVTDGVNIYSRENTERWGCVDALTHELKHVHQRQALGFLEWQALQLAGVDMEAHPQWTPDNMINPSGLNYPLIKISIPLVYRP